MKLTALFNEFFRSERAGGFILVVCTALSLAAANSPIHADYTGFWNAVFAGAPLYHWINDGLMTVFFLLIGLELEREIYTGELSDPKKAALPAVAAAGGMLFPAFIYYLATAGTGMERGAGIPTATDIAFAVGILSLMGNRVPSSLKVFIIALAVIDDLGAVIVISLFYSGSISAIHLGAALAVFGILLILNRLKVYRLIPYVCGGALMWYLMLHSGVHAAVSGVMLAFAIPFGDGGSRSPSYKVQHALHYPVTLFVLPVFALANTAVTFDGIGGVIAPHTIGIFLGLAAGKPLGIFSFSVLSSLAGITRIPRELGYRHILGAGFLGGIGFTMSIFITLLAFGDPATIATCKIAVFSASAASAIIGIFVLYAALRSSGEASVK